MVFPRSPAPVDLQAGIALLGGLSPVQFMRRHWQRRPLLVRQAIPGVKPPASRAGLFELAARDDVESRLVVRDDDRWSVRHGPLPRRALPPVSRPGWTLLVQGLDLHVPAAQRMLSAFRFLPDARLDDLMISWASEGGGVGPHLDAYDVFLIQVHGRRRWRIGRVADDRFVEGLPLRILRHFEPEHDWVLEPGDLLYLPPRWGHDGTADGGECMTCSVGFRVPTADEVAREVLSRLLDQDGTVPSRHYTDPGQPATAAPGRIPERMQDFARDAVARAVAAPHALEQALGEWLTEPKPRVWFASAPGARADAGVRLAAATRMMYDARHVYLNGESFRAGGRDATLMHRLADRRALDAADCRRLSPAAGDLLVEWLEQGWVVSGDRT